MPATHDVPSPSAPDTAKASAIAPLPDNPNAQCSAVVGLQWGDEGKGKVVDLLAAQHDAVVRFNGGANAGHSVVVQGQRYSLHLIPSGILYPSKLAVVGNGVVVDPAALINEIDALTSRGISTGGLLISDRAHVVMPYHKAEDQLREALLGKVRTEAEGAGSVAEIGTTKRGIGPAYSDKVQRAAAIRIGDLLRPDVLKEKIGIAIATKAPLFREMSGLADVKDALNEAALLEFALAAGERLRPSITDTTYLLHGLLNSGKRMLFESANGTLLDVDHGTFPFVTGSSVAVAGIGTGAGIPVQRLGRTVGVMKAYTTRVGGGPMPTELTDATAHRIRERGREYGTTTGRPRRVGWLDLVALKYAAMLNGITSVSLMMLDVLAGFETIKVCTAYEVRGKRTERFIADAHDLAKATPIFTELPGYGDEVSAARRRDELPDNCRRYIDFIEKSLGVPAMLLSVGPDREQTILQ
ncbi:MAG: adenylosuccinate synthase [Planctomycetota bacterium]|nr:adenylosuccinate synthase [Planctomycetota bacterium]